MLRQRMIEIGTIQRSLQSVDLAILIILVLTQISNLTSSHHRAKIDKNVERNNQLGGYMNLDFVPKCELPSNQKIVEEYWGFESILAVGEEATKVDSVIHALGATRKAFQLRLSGAGIRLVTSLPLVGN